MMRMKQLVFSEMALGTMTKLNDDERLADLFHHGNAEAKRDYLFYLAVGSTKLKEYSKALKFIKAFLHVEPANRQAQELEATIKNRMKKEGIKGMAIVGGAALAVSGLVGLGIALAKR
ncbi:hypothetical protein HPB51_005347 [Rhipicephalus microplus]|uniref:Mitochondrial fission 1 protein n=1 Tax=Rhipicephalus microplus TaxID=6941 RepID=A0A9J6EX81_RHIMP|nr:hypothetical protein HPB51_005347 [Rhipicephalus microplus]